MINKTFFTYMILALILFACIGCEQTVVRSLWCNQNIVIDGNGDEWKNNITYFEGSRTGVGIFNDDKYLYFYITSDDHQLVSQIRMSGFTVLFRNKEKKNNVFGICYPIAGKPGQAAGMRPFEMNNRETDTAKVKALLEASLQTLAVIKNSDTLPMHLKIAEQSGMLVRVEPSLERFSYEARIALNNDSSDEYSIGMGNDTILEITLETNEIEKPSGNMPPQGGRGGPMMGNGNMGPPPQGGGMKPPSGKGPMGSGPGNAPQIERFKVDCLVNIAKK